MRKKDYAQYFVETLEKVYPDSLCSLDYDRERPYQLLIQVRLAAQCTDARVNLVSKDLFKRYPTLESFAQANLEDLEEMVKLLYVSVKTGQLMFAARS